MLLLPATSTATLPSMKAISDVAIALSMIVEMTSLTPRVTLSGGGDAGPHGADQHGDDHDDQ